MASLIHDGGGRRRILVVGADGVRRAIRLGRCAPARGRKFLDRIEELAAAVRRGQTLEPDLIAWASRLPAVMYDRLARARLVAPRIGMDVIELDQFVTDLIDGRGDAKPATIKLMKRARTELVNHFGAKRCIGKITLGDADDFFRALLVRGLAPNTARRLAGVARSFFRVALRKKLIAVNPFGELATNVRPNRKRLHFVDRERAARLLAACPDEEWKLIVVLSRFGGLRCPSEHLAMRWGDVDWARNRLRIRSSKTEHHEGKDVRTIPLFPELRAHLLTAYTAADEGSEFVIGRRRGANLRTQFRRIIVRAGLTPWPKLFQNLRSTRETELAETFPTHVVCAWIGNSAAVAAASYLQVTDEHYADAAGR